MPLLICLRAHAIRLVKVSFNPSEILSDWLISRSFRYQTIFSLQFASNINFSYAIVYSLSQVMTGADSRALFFCTAEERATFRKWQSTCTPFHCSVRSLVSIMSCALLDCHQSPAPLWISLSPEPQWPGRESLTWWLVRLVRTYSTSVPADQTVCLASTDAGAISAVQSIRDCFRPWCVYVLCA